MREGAERRCESRSGDLDRSLLALFRTRGNELVSGRELSAALGVSRTAVWKRIGILREAGFSFDSVPSKGYRLRAMPDLLYPAIIGSGLTTRRLASTITLFLRTGSTNAAAGRLAEEGAAEGTVVLAECQDHGRGRRGRSWESPPGVNLYCSLVLRPSILPSHAPQLTFLSAVAVARAIRRCTRLTPSIKWPNDILVNGKKVAGLLNEMTAETDTVTSVVLGIGVNLNMRREQFPRDLRHPASSLMIEGGSPVDRAEFTRALLESLDDLYARYLEGGYGEIRNEWVSLCGFIGKRIRISDASLPECEGVAVGIDDAGALIIRKDDGTSDRVLAGDVTLCA